MNDNLKFKQLKDLASDISLTLDKLASGALSISELEKLSDASRELHERIIVLRYKAYDADVKGQQVVIEKEKEEAPVAPVIPSISFRIEEPKQELPVQVSLIDAIEEVTKTEAIVEAIKEEIISPAANTIQTPTPVINTPIISKESVYDRLTKSIVATESIAEQREHDPISDLKRAISLNQRFQFSRELFKGNNQDYEVAIDKLNNLSREDALKHLASLRNKYAWSEESPVTTDFVGLIERRHQ